ncbi:hypothetical protein Pogu_0003 [Pyrobaculum oguniense TE7]|uniref:Uncharacterized protein n=1 Tax=Pyrobaculum oguniense (strain DSM 13380 / JCM 10595 / TE7) TaxID=698757 RepID=H6Q600_PYROT|nr:hypothetical protein Pogu_0003 [Pyrobaculum oguniense TE7]
MKCVKEVKLRRGWACVAEGEHIPRGALVLTKPPEKIAQYADFAKQIFFKYLQEENLAENTLVITDGKGRAYAFRMPNAKLTVVLYADDPAGEALELVKYLDGTRRGFILDERAVAKLYAEAGALGQLRRPPRAEGVPAEAPAAVAVGEASGAAEWAEGRGGSMALDAEALCEAVRGDGELLRLAGELVEIYRRSPEAARRAIRIARGLA